MSGATIINTRATRSETIFHLHQAFKLALSLVLFYWLALWMNWDVPQYGALAIVIVSLGTSGASIEKGVMRIVGTTIGVAVGFLILGMFSHDRWATMLAFASYLTAIGYFMQGSRYSYAWYAAAFVPLVVWGDNYPNFDTAFNFGVFRWLETTVGVLIYTTVDLVFWPRRAGDQLYPLGKELWTEVLEQFRNYREQLAKGQLAEGDSNLRTKMAGTLSQTLSTLQDSYFDTPDVRAQKKVWEVWRVNARCLVDSLEVWRECIDDCRALNPDRLLPGLGAELDTLDKRLERIGVLWEARRATVDATDTDDSWLLETLALDLDSSAYADLTHFERAAVMVLVGQLEILDQTSRELLLTMRVLAGLESSRRFRVSSWQREIFQPSRWYPGRLIHALFPPAVFIIAFFLWVLMNPPAGPKVPMFAGLLSLVVLRTPMNPRVLLTVFLLSIFCAVAPVYWLVMPQLSTGLALLSLIFLYSFIFGYLGGRSPALKSGPIIMFAVMTGISNQQSYSFQALVDGALMILLAGSLVTVVYFFFSPMRPEQTLLRSLRRFFHGCAQVIGGFALDGPSKQATGRRIRKRYLESMVLPAPAQIHTAQKNLDYKLYPDNSPDKVQRLQDSVQSIAYRLESLELAHDQMASHSSEFPEPFTCVGQEACKTMRQIFERWASLDPGDEFEQQRDSLQRNSQDLEQQLDALETSGDQESISDQALRVLYTMLGAIRGLIDAMANTQRIISQINWRQWALARF